MSNPCLKDKNGNIANPKIPRYEKKGFLLWKNNNIAKFPAGTQIKLVSSKYDLIIWLFATSVGGATNHLVSGCLKGNNCILNGRTVSSNISVRRQLTYVDDTTYQAEDGYGNAGIDDNNAIPLMAIGFTLS